MTLASPASGTPQTGPVSENGRSRAHRELDLMLDRRLGNGYSGDISLTLTVKRGGLIGIRIKTEEVRN